MLKRDQNWLFLGMAEGLETCASSFLAASFTPNQPIRTRDFGPGKVINRLAEGGNPMSMDTGEGGSHLTRPSASTGMAPSLRYDAPPVAKKFPMTGQNDMKEAFRKLEPATRKWITALKKRFVLEDYHERLFDPGRQAWDRSATGTADDRFKMDRFKRIGSALRNLIHRTD